MTNKNMIMILMMLIVGIIAVHATTASLTDGLISYYNWSDYNDMLGNNNLINNDTALNTSICHLDNSCMIIDSIYDEAYNANPTGLSWGSEPRTMGCWIYLPTVPVSPQSGIFGYGLAGGNSLWEQGASNSQYASYGYAQGDYTFGTLTQSAWVLDIAVFDGAQNLNYIDAVNIFNYSNVYNTVYGVLSFGGWEYVPHAIDEAVLDDCFVYNRTLSQSEIDQLYNSGAGLVYPFNVSCVEDWINTSTVCDGFNYTIKYTDNNMCGTYVNLPLDNGTVINCTPPACVENWISNNTACNGTSYIVQYYDSANCGTYANLPLNNGTEVDCTPTSVTGAVVRVNNAIVNIMVAMIIVAVIFALGALLLGKLGIIESNVVMWVMITVLVALALIILVLSLQMLNVVG
jgi:hypothetical protein